MIAAIQRWIAWVGEGRIGPFNAALALAALYCIVQTVALTLISHWTGTSASIDDAEQLIYMPHLWGGYGGSQPPLYTWIAWTFSQVFGQTILTLKIVKYLILFLAVFSVHAALRLLGLSLLTATVGAFGMMTIPQIFWESQHTLTHSIAALGFSALALLALMHVIRTRTTLSYVLFGLAAALSMLSKFNDAIFIATILAAALSVREFRPAVLDRRMLLSVLVLIAALMPTVLWSIGHPDAVLARTRKLGLAAPAGFWGLRVDGFVQLVVSTFNFCVVTLVIGAAAFAAERLNPFGAGTSGAPSEKFVRRILLIGFGLVAVLVLVSGSTAIPERWLTPMLFLAPAYLAIRAAAPGPAGRKVQIHILGTAIVIAVLVAPATWYKQAIGGEGKSRSARMDHQAFYDDLQKDGPVNTIIGYSSWVGNFRLIKPDLVLMNEEVPELAERIKAPAVLVWLDQACPGDEVWRPLYAAGYRFGDRTEQLEVPEIFGGTRHASFIRLVKEGDPAADPDGRLCSQWWRERK